ncbi:AAA family ATPase [Actinoplanes sp. KI2]|uniref:ATP-binding protein n=1 Tax=Actinoplanes sp. KI2 TaxID=2983315 RepID=UPI0021D5741B|nr:AAA family ATPase [Actinoplanes sp. KI2]MCU7728865.1 AAA family ATPase [Actinoplanes sp. KI2]
MPQETAFIGRTDQLALLGQRLEQAREGQAGTVLIGGEAGIGKSRLVSTFAGATRATGAHVLAGACEEYFGDPMPYGPLLEMLEAFGREYGAARATALGGPAYERLTAFFDLGGDPISSPQQVFLAVRKMLDAIGADAPTVLILEDLHWADPSTLDIVRHLGQAGAQDRRLLTVASYRSTELDRGDPLWQLLANASFLRRVERLELPALNQRELRELLSAGRRGAVDHDLARRCFEWSDGIPFYAEQLMAAGALENPEDVRLPPDTRSVVLARLGVLSENALRVLRVAAVAGRAMSRRLLREVGEFPPDVLRGALQECFDRQMLVAGPGADVYRFRHALLREAVYQTTVRDIQVDLHIAMAKALAADSSLCLTEGSAAAEQASHWYHAGSRPEALASAVQAGDAAVRQLAFPSAEVQFSRALAVWRQVEDAERRAGLSRVELLARAADAARWSGHVDRAVAYIEEAVAEAPDDARWQERLGSYRWEAGRWADAQAAYRTAARLLDGSPASAIKARSLAGLALGRLQAGQYAEGGDLAEAALNLARAAGAVPEEGRALNISGLALGLQGNPEGEVRLRRALEIARAADHIEDLFRAYGNLGLVLEHAGRLREAAAVTREGLATARQLDLAHTRQGTVLAGNTSAALVLLGEWDDAEEIITELSLDRPVAESLYPRLTLAEIKVARGEFDEARELLAAIEGVEYGRDPRFLGPLHAVRAELALWAGDARAVGEIAAGVRAVQAGENTLELLRLCALGMRSAADRRAVRDGDELARLAGRAQGEPSSTEAGQLVLLCKAERRRIRGTDRPSLWREVADGWVALDRPYPAAYARWRQAAAAGDRDEARAPLREAYRMAAALRAEPLRAEVERSARRLRVDLTERPAPAALPYGLTPAEFDTLRHRYEGLDTAAIAAERKVSKRTVETQLRRAYEKLRVHSAAEAITKARRERLFD